MFFSGLNTCANCPDPRSAHCPKGHAPSMLWLTRVKFPSSINLFFLRKMSLCLKLSHGMWRENLKNTTMAIQYPSDIPWILCTFLLTYTKMLGRKRKEMWPVGCLQVCLMFRPTNQATLSELWLWPSDLWELPKTFYSKWPSECNKTHRQKKLPKIISYGYIVAQQKKCP